MNIKKKSYFFNIWTLLLFGLILRLAITGFDYSGDLNNHLTWGKDIIIHGTNGFYGRNIPKIYGQALPNYPPLAMISFSIMYFLYSIVWPIIWNIKIHIGIIPASFIWFWEQQKFILPVFIKIPAIMADLGTAYLIYLIIKKIKIKNLILSPELAASFILFNPAFFYNSAYWGQIDSLPFPFLLISLYLLLFSKKPVLSAIFFTLSLLLKQTVVILTPLYILLFLYKNSFRSILKSALFSFAVFVLIFLPFHLKLDIVPYAINTWINKIMLNFGSEYLTAHAFNFWGLTTGLGHIRDLGFLIFGIPARYIATIFVGLLISIILIVLQRRKYAINQLIAAGYLIPFSMFLFSTRMHERHLLATLPFLLIASALKKELIPVFLFISFFHFLNMYNGWWSPHPPEIVVSFFSSPLVVNILIIIAIAIFFYLFIKYLKRKP